MAIFDAENLLEVDEKFLDAVECLDEEEFCTFESNLFDEKSVGVVSKVCDIVVDLKVQELDSAGLLPGGEGESPIVAG